LEHRPGAVYGSFTRLETLADATGIDTRGDWEHTME
jgi:hypothetical protein